MGRKMSKIVFAVVTSVAVIFGGVLVGCAGNSPSSSGSETNIAQNATAESDAENGEEQKENADQSILAGETFELVGEEIGVGADGTEAPVMPWEYAKQWDWTGTMRFSVSQLTVYGSAEQAGFPDVQADLENDEKLAIFEVTAQNVDAVCRQSVIEESGVNNFNLAMFTLERADGTPIEGRFSNGPQVDGLTMHNGGDGSNRAWVEQGASATYRIACILPADVDKGVEYKVNCCGAVDQDAPTVYLGKANFV